MPEEPLGLLVSIVRRRIKQAVLGRVAGHKLAPGQFWILNALLEHPGLSQSGLAERLRIDAPTASRVIATLTDRKLMRMAPDSRDRRRSVLRLTSAGEKLARALAPLATELRLAMVENMSETEVASVRLGLEKIISNLDRFEARASIQRADP
jgi:DNA-binding MarR family transcriptional regulator